MAWVILLVAQANRLGGASVGCDKPWQRRLLLERKFEKPRPTEEDAQTMVACIRAVEGAGANCLNPTKVQVDFA